MALSDNHNVPDTAIEKALNAVESMAVRRTLLRMTTKDFNSLVVAALKYLDGKPMDQAATRCRAPAKSGLHRSGGYEGLKGPAGSSAVVAQGGGDAGGSGETQDGQGEITQGGHDAGTAAGPNLGKVFAVGDVAVLLQG